jgi:surface antigen
VVLLGAVIGFTGAAPAAPGATNLLVTGVARCSGGKTGVGVYVVSSSGGSKWADSWTMPGQPSYQWYSATIASPTTSSTISLHVGCGGSRSAWEKDLYSAGFSVGSKGRTINLACDTTKATRTIACSTPRRGPEASKNLGSAGYCTWGAYEKWKESTGYYPDIGGHAIQMDDNAQSKGFYVWPVPHARAMVVFNRNTYGHVGWVTRVYKNSAGQVAFDYWDMNGGSIVDAAAAKTTDFNRFVLRTGKVWDSTQRFILAPT